ncbi:MULTISPECIES: DUF3800 domain-containing protein [unclassified Herbaspirillum]|uniref:DUF3800 domain-containing protein n=1 Tax=unclassified Herbaspirillum TaxID=2624150 RepID=UPI00160CD4D1|nr:MULTISPECIES: DUF3800 domain-containing protein [unclassified Herbaspirillum]
MHLLYVDESGSVSDISQKFFVLAGVSVFERNTHWVEQNLNQLAISIDATTPNEIELHGSPIRSGKGAPWRKMPQEQRSQVIKNALDEGKRRFHRCTDP